MNISVTTPILTIHCIVTMHCIVITNNSKYTINVTSHGKQVTLISIYYVQ